MFKQIIAATIAIATTVIVSGHTVQAAVTADGTGANTTGSITLNPGGAITLDAAPDLDFGSQEISTSKATYTTAGSTPLKVTNPGFASGWNVSVTASKFVNGNTELKGAELIVNNSKTVAFDGTNTSATPVGIKATTITPGGSAVSVLNAAQEAGVGVWTSDWTSVSLEVPAGNVSGNYSAQLDWTLENAPK